MRIICLYKFRILPLLLTSDSTKIKKSRKLTSFVSWIPTARAVIVQISRNIKLNSVKINSNISEDGNNNVLLSRDRSLFRSSCQQISPPPMNQTILSLNVTRPHKTTRQPPRSKIINLLVVNCEACATR